MRCWKDAEASARALNVCDGANTAPQTTRAYATMRGSCESADAVGRMHALMQLPLTARLTETRLQLTAGLSERKMLMEWCEVVCYCCF